MRGPRIHGDGDRGATTRPRFVAVACITLGAWFVLGAPARATAGNPGGARPVALKLPGEIVYGHAVGPDSAVIFRHETHVAFAGQKCTGCHPRPFLMLTPTRLASHRAMNAGQSCGTCHDGRRAFGVSDRKSCLACHTGRFGRASSGEMTATPSSPRGPKAIRYPRGEASPGQVTFRHATHAVDARCGACHPKPFAMKSAGARPGGGMHAASACGACHDGAKTFAVDDADACARCHAESKGTP